jgi:stage III sporulation protein AG
MVTYVSSKEIVPAYDSKNSENNTSEKDSGGGTRSIGQSSRENGVAYEEVQGGSRKPIILKELLPEVKGVVIVADGASDPEVKEDLTRATQILLDVPIHKVSVFDRKK